MAAEIAAIGVDEVAIADTIGVAVPADVRHRVAAVREVVGYTRLRVHVHNTRNTGYASALAAADAGVTVLDSSLGGIGAALRPERDREHRHRDLVFALERSGYDTGLDLDELCRASEWLAAQLGRPVPSLLPKAGGFRRPPPDPARG